MRSLPLINLLLFPAWLLAEGGNSAPFRSHAPTRPLPVASSRPLLAGPAYYVHPTSGDDGATGSQDKPWRTLSHAVTKLQAGDTLVLRTGIYYEHVVASLTGTAEKPITIRAYPNELAILDGGLREFFDQPAMAWETCPGGAAGEFQSTKTYAGLDKDAGEGPAVFGNFGDSWLPLQAYRFHGDLRSDNPWWNIESKVGKEEFVSCGPGIFYDRATGRIHCRLVHTKLPGLGDDNYRGETDPRKLPLVIAGSDQPPLRLEHSQNVRLWDLILRGSRTPSLQVRDCRNVELDGLSAYGGNAAMQVHDTHGLRMQHCALRGLGAPWTFRGMLKYRSVEGKIFAASPWDPTGNDNRDFEIRYCEFTDSCDGVFVGNVRGLRFHHNLIENVTDDGMFLTAGTGYDGATHGGDMHIYQNRFARILTCFAFGVGHGRQKVLDFGNGVTGKQTGSGAYIFRNVFDLRRPVWYGWPSGPDAPQELTDRGRFAGDHGSPAWEPIWIYHNTILAGNTPRYGYGADGLNGGLARGTSRRIFNNIICLTSGMPGSTLPATTTDFAADGNLLWSLEPPSEIPADLFRKFRASPEFAASQAHYPPGWTTHDVVADPRLEKLPADWREPTDLRLGKGSAAIDAGVPIPAAWPDPLRATDAGKPDLGAISVGTTIAAIGGNAPRSTEPWHFAPQPSTNFATQPKALIVEGYPAFEAPIFAYLLRKAGYHVETSERVWFDAAKLGNYKLVIYDGSLARAKVEKTAFNAADIAHVRGFLESGGTLIVTRERADLFAAPEGRKLLDDLVGSASANIRDNLPQFRVRKPNHPWLQSLAGQTEFPWLANGGPLRCTQGESLIGSEKGSSLLHRAPLGRGQFLYLGWSPAASIPGGRLKTSVEMEKTLDDQVAIVRAMLMVEK
ncbi:MAG: hypothetical protein SFU86_03230 [Pirellulaceae bacterium]|nr:hypothetical protein [Pirellulaceae bacterium]